MTKFRINILAYLSLIQLLCIVHRSTSDGPLESPSPGKQCAILNKYDNHYYRAVVMSVNENQVSLYFCALQLWNPYESI